MDRPVLTPGSCTHCGKDAQSECATIFCTLAVSRIGQRYKRSKVDKPAIRIISTWDEVPERFSQACRYGPTDEAQDGTKETDANSKLLTDESIQASPTQDTTASSDLARAAPGNDKHEKGIESEVSMRGHLGKLTRLPSAFGVGPHSRWNPRWLLSRSFASILWLCTTLTVHMSGHQKKTRVWDDAYHG